MTTITSNEPEARIYVDGEYKGKGTVVHEDTKIVGSTTGITLKKKGCRPQYFTFSRSERVDYAACAGGIVLVPLLWIMKYKPVHNYEFECEKL